MQLIDVRLYTLKKRRLFVTILLLSSVMIFAKADTANLNLTLTITMPPQCTFNGNQATSVSFGEVQQGLIDGTSYKRMPINYGLVCTGLEKNNLTMTLSWNELTLNGESTIKTNRTDLGIAIYRDSTRVRNNSAINFTYGSSPQLYAVPTKPTGKMLTDAGRFTGVMTMTLNYQ
ncbi:fimbrial protein [Providencia vermicola]|uniref:Fimbrial protein n=2 Tax=Providencia TaxID=586 RepID=A0AAI9HWB7_PROST|nr:MULTISPECIES: fimbrial protein [Providencia]ELR5045946.1 fimbrial protein [Providencia rettgeri]ELR5034176.1 fimbrial protein [Providencia stuartii]ELR5121339.1 fimbrial protein [Providencia stuartii]ELR5142112.1 fimbrial protein [Providencia stuartii]ELR5291547.1 fimbrial protein [Providencia stuartii]